MGYTPIPPAFDDLALDAALNFPEGFRVEERHTNPLKICHGGMMATVADMLIPCAAMYQCGGVRGCRHPVC